MPKRAIGLALLVVGVILLIYGIQANDSVGSAFSKMFGQGPTDETMWFMLGGAAALVIGLVLAAVPARRAS